jgi:hypothetical protein
VVPEIVENTLVLIPFTAVESKGKGKRENGGKENVDKDGSDVCVMKIRKIFSVEFKHDVSTSMLCLHDSDIHL